MTRPQPTRIATLSLLSLLILGTAIGGLADAASVPQHPAMFSPRTSPTAESTVRRWMAAAREGKSLGGIPFADGETISAAQTAWGKATKQTAAGAGIYLTYHTHHAAFGIGSGDQIFDLRSFAPVAKAITAADMRAVLGAPGLVRYADGTTIDVYPAGPRYQLSFVFAGASSTVNHVDVIWPRGTVDLMGQNVPNPTIAVTHKPSPPHNFFSFAIHLAPPGYRLAELEWIPTQGPAVITTPPEALLAGAKVLGFEKVGAEGQYRFNYRPAMRGETGKVRLIYQNTPGSAIIGSSAAIRLP